MVVKDQIWCTKSNICNSHLTIDKHGLYLATHRCSISKYIDKRIKYYYVFQSWNTSVVVDVKDKMWTPIVNYLLFYVNTSQVKRTW